jgi:hypothetical protein
MAKRIFLQIELPSEEDREAFKLWCQLNRWDMSGRARELIAEDIKAGKKALRRLKG